MTILYQIPIFMQKLKQRKQYQMVERENNYIDDLCHPYMTYRYAMGLATQDKASIVQLPSTNQFLSSALLFGHHMKENAVIKQWNFASVKESTIDQDGLVLSVRSWKNYESLESDIEIS